MRAPIGPRDPGGFTTPRYGSGALNDLLPSVLAAMGVGGPDPLGLAGSALSDVRRVVVLLVDGLGFHLLPVAAPVAPGLAAAVGGRVGALSVLTSAFPSTTPTNLVGVGTGAPPGQHGVVGFTVLIPGTDRTITHVSWPSDVDPVRWQPRSTQFDRARAAGIATYVVAPAHLARSGLSIAAYRGAGYRGAEGIDATVAAVLGASTEADRSLVYAYHPDLDRAAHVAGPGSPDWLAQAAAVDELVTAICAALPEDAALVVTADHGAVTAGESDRLDLDAMPALSAGTRLVTGDPRVRYAHVEPGATGDVLEAWRAQLAHRALVVARDEAVERGWFGPVTRAAAARIGDVVAVATGCHVLTRPRAESGASELVGYHGSLTEAEILVPLLVLRPGELCRSVTPPG